MSTKKKAAIRKVAPSKSKKKSQVAQPERRIITATGWKKLQKKS